MKLTASKKTKPVDKNTVITLPVITFNYSFKSAKEAKQESIRALMNCINDEEILNEIKVKTIATRKEG